MSIAVVSVLSVLAYLVYTRLGSWRAARLPPGPPRLPILGNAHQMPLEYEEKTFANWGKQFGDLIYLQVFRKPIVIANTLEIAQDLMEKRGAQYSDRPHSTYAEEMIHFKPILAMMPYNERGRLHRRWYQSMLETKSALDSYVPLLNREADKLLLGLLAKPEGFISHIKMFAGGVMLEIAYGHTVTDAEDEYIDFADQAIAGVSAGGALFAGLMDFFPALVYLPAWLPGAKIKREGLRTRGMVRRMLDVPLDRLRDAMANGKKFKECFATFIMQEISVDGKYTPEQNEDIRGAAGQVYVAGSDTTITTLLTFVLAMVLHPDVAQKAQAEIDQVVGPGRLPDLKDKDSMPYFDCILMELYRWNPPIRLGIAHTNPEEDEYRGFTIPTRSTVIPNIWAMGRDEEMYADPEAFRPERFLEMDSDDLSKKDPHRYIFGFGRRLCPGRYLADASIWLAAANMLAAFNMVKVRDAMGQEITPAAEFASGLFSQPKSFTCTIKPRSQAYVDLISRENARSEI